VPARPQTFEIAVSQAQGAFWGNGREDSSMLVKIALRGRSR
jgi:hypothetical protein